jgi:hypothetical protein
MPRYGMYNDPAMAQSFENIAKMFAPPSAQDAYAAAKAAEVQQKMGALAQMYAAVSDPNVTRDQFDRAGVATNLYSPSQSYYAVDQGNATDLKKNSADNARALATNSADNARQFAQTRYGALSEGQSLPELPQSVADMYKIPQSPVVQGNIKLGQGDKVVAPDGKEYQGNAKPLSGEQVFNARNTQTGQTDIVTIDPTTNQIKVVQPNSVKYNASLQGAGSDTGLAPTTANNTTSNNLSANIAATEMLLDNYENLLKNNPGVAGAPGFVRGVAQDVGSVASELTAAFGKNGSPDANVTLDQIQQFSKSIAPNRDPNIQIARKMLLDLAYANAQMQNPTGEVSQQALLRSIESLNGGLLANNESALEGAQAMRMLLNTKKKQVEMMRNPQAVSPAGVTPPAPGAVEKWERDANGQLRKVQ